MQLVVFCWCSSMGWCLICCLLLGMPLRESVVGVLMVFFLFRVCCLWPWILMGVCYMPLLDVVCRCVFVLRSDCLLLFLA